MKKIISYLLSIAYIPIGYGQVSGIYPLPLLRYQDQVFFENPASVGSLSSGDIRLHHASYTGLSASVGLNYLNATLRKASAKTNNVHYGGLVIHSEYETDLLKRNRVYIKYCWSTLLTSKTRLSAGMQIGFFNYSVKSSGSSSGVSEWAPDASAGIWLYKPRFTVGIALPQFLGSTVQPINRIYSLPRYIHINADFTVIKSYSAKLILAARAYYNSLNYKGAALASQLVLAKNFSTEVSYLINQGLIFSAGVTEIAILSLRGELIFSYMHSLLNRRLLNTDRLEIGLRFSIAPVNKQEEVKEEEE